VPKLKSLDKSLFQHQGFWQLWVSGLLIVIGAAAFPVALAVTVLENGGTASTLGLILAARVFSSVLLVLAGGVWADRFPRKYVMIFADILRAILTLAIVFVSIAHLSSWILAAIIFVMGAGEALGFPASGAILPSILPVEKLPAGNAMRSVTAKTGSIVGPSLGGILVATVGSRITFIVVALLFFVGTSLLFGIKEEKVKPTEVRPPFTHELIEGLRAVKKLPWVAWIIAIASVQLMVVIGVEIVLLPVITRRQFHTNSVFAASAAAASIGGVITAVYFARKKVKRPGFISIISWMFFAAAPLALAFPISPWFVIGCYFFAGLANEPFGVYWATALQREIPQEMQGRVFSVDYMGTLALLPIGMAMAGPITHLIGEREYLVGAAIFHIILCFLMLAIPGAIYFRSPNSPISEQPMTQ
jgi:MFS family permease